MQFSIARILLATAFISFVLAATFGFPAPFGFLSLTFISMVVLPPFIIVGVVNTRGLRQSFFLGAMFSGIPHFIIGVYYALMVGMSAGDLSFSDFSEADEFFPLKFIHLVGYVIGTMGGLSGMAAYGFIKMGNRNSSHNQPLSESNETSTSAKTPSPPEIYSTPKHSTNKTDTPTLPPR